MTNKLLQRPCAILLFFVAIFIVFLILHSLSMRFSNSTPPNESYETTLKWPCVCDIVSSNEDSCLAAQRYPQAVSSITAHFTERLRKIFAPVLGETDPFSVGAANIFFGDLGKIDSVVFAWSLVKIKQRYDPKKILVVDIGANIGQTSSVFQNVFNNLACRKSSSLGSEGLRSHLCRPSLGFTPVIAFEPSAVNAEILLQTSKASGWALHGWQFQSFAIGEQPGVYKFFSNNQGGDEQGSLVRVHESYVTNQADVLVNVTTLSLFVENNADLRARELFLVKIDVEGFDPEVLKGMQDFLAQQRIKFLIFEYGNKWFSGRPEEKAAPIDLSKSLRLVVDGLSKQNYICFLLTKEGVIPLSPPVWTDKYEFRQWSNVFCGRLNDPEVCEVSLKMTSDATDRLFLEDLFLHYRKPKN